MPVAAQRVSIAVLFGAELGFSAVIELALDLAFAFA
jgi:hypothetical protein